jgi:hypothetical protein
MESVCDDFGKWMNRMVVEVCIREEEEEKKSESVSRCWMYAKDLTSWIWKSTVYSWMKNVERLNVSNN